MIRLWIHVYTIYNLNPNIRAPQISCEQKKKETESSFFVFAYYIGMLFADRRANRKRKHTDGTHFILMRSFVSFNAAIIKCSIASF